MVDAEVMILNRKEDGEYKESYQRVLEGIEPAQRRFCNEKSD